jgi:hypothetical protein
MDALRRQLHHEAVLDDIKRIENEVKAAGDAAKGSQPSADPNEQPKPQPTVEPSPPRDES